MKISLSSFEANNGNQSQFTNYALLEALKSELIIPRSPSPSPSPSPSLQVDDIIPLNHRSSSNVDARVSRDERLANLKVIVPARN
jgi:hypothetical protein